MKTFVFAMFLAAVTISGGILFNNQIDNVTEAMAEKEHIICVHLIEGDKASALSEIENLISYIDEKRTVLASTIDHKLIDDIEACIAQIRGLAEQGEFSLALSMCRSLEHLIEHLPANYTLSLQNIL